MIKSLFLFSSFSNALQISVLITPKQRSAYSETFKQFTQETGIKVTTIARNDKDYKKDLPIWLIEGKETPDVLYWHASQRLYQYAEKGVIQPLTKLWEEGNFDNDFLQFKDTVTYQGEVYALPISYYYWGLFYKKSLVKKYGGVPQTWQEFIQLCEVMKKDGITPLGIGTKNHWPAAAWFDYINLRLNGHQFHQQTLLGEISFYDKRLQNVFIEWKRLIDRHFFNSNHHELKWSEVLPHLYREKIGFMLTGSFASKSFSKRMQNDLAVISFPQIANIPITEEAPVEIFMIAKNTKRLPEAEMFIRFMAKATVQSDHNNRTGYLPANNKATIGQQPFIQSGAKILKSATSVTQYLDRDTIPKFEKRVIPLLAQFMQEADIKKTTAQLEQARIDVF